MPEIYQYSSNVNFLKELVRINPAYVCCASESIINDKNALETVATENPMSMVHLFKTRRINKDSFIEMIRHNPTVLQNYWADGALINDEELINAALYQIKDANKNYEKMIYGYEVAVFCKTHDQIEEAGDEQNGYTKEQIEYIAKFAVARDFARLDEIVPDRKTLLELLKKYPQAVKTVSKECIELYDEDFFNENSSMLCSDGKKRFFYPDIKEVFEKNPDVEKFYVMEKDKFEQYMNSYIIKQREEMGIYKDDTAEKEAAKARIIAKSEKLKELKELKEPKKTDKTTRKEI